MENIRKNGLLQISLLVLLILPLKVIAQDTTCPCCSKPYHQFDFWVGDWVVYSKGRMVGFNKIMKIESNCILRENWVSTVSSHTGTSYSFYNRNTRLWTHVWVDNLGNPLYLTGIYRDKKMVLTSREYTDVKGNRIIDRITWFNNDNGTVRQLWEQSQDGGLDFSVFFDGLYRRRK